MIEREMNRDRVSLRIGICIALAGFAADIFFVSWSPDFDAFLLLFLVVPTTTLIFVGLAIWAGKKAAVSLGSVLLVCLVGTYAIGRHSALLRSEIRWWSSRPIWKQRVLAQSDIPGQLKHLDWDGWGWGGNDTEVYLVYDPTDQLKNASGTSEGMHGSGLPCDVWQIRRFEPHWYNVVFFTETSWDSCP
jgi:hypothetical protein